MLALGVVAAMIFWLSNRTDPVDIVSATVPAPTVVPSAVPPPVTEAQAPSARRVLSKPQAWVRPASLSPEAADALLEQALDGQALIGPLRACSPLDLGTLQLELTFGPDGLDRALLVTDADQPVDDAMLKCCADAVWAPAWPSFPMPFTIEGKWQSAGE